ncbi:hypothetical protein JHK87_016416 [Glycine soja]|nr:hypothetical protein JHK87_016416 [Glycine soja]
MKGLSMNLFCFTSLARATTQPNKAMALHYFKASLLVFVKDHGNLKPFTESFNEHLETGHVKHVESIDNGTCVDNMVASDMGENNIISDILSLELDAWEGSLVNLLGKRDELYRSFKAATLQKFQDKNQSRLSFVR